MADTYLIKSEKTVTRQEGDTPAPFSFIVPDAIDMDLFEMTFVVVDAEGVEFIRKTTEGSAPSITVEGQLITIPFDVEDTTGYAGEHTWECEVHNDTPEVITIGRGPFIIIAQIIT